MRLIDADKLKNDIAKWLNPKACIEEPRMVEVDDIAVSTIMEIEEQPTAFYEERVLETLKKSWIWRTEKETDAPERIYCNSMKQKGMQEESHTPWRL